MNKFKISYLYKIYLSILIKFQCMEAIVFLKINIVSLIITHFLMIILFFMMKKPRNVF